MAVLDLGDYRIAYALMAFSGKLSQGQAVFSTGHTQAESDSFWVLEPHALTIPDLSAGGKRPRGSFCSSIRAAPPHSTRRPRRLGRRTCGKRRTAYSEGGGPACRGRPCCGARQPSSTD